MTSVYVGVEELDGLSHRLSSRTARSELAALRMGEARGWAVLEAQAEQDASGAWGRVRLLQRVQREIVDVSWDERKISSDPRCASAKSVLDQ